MPAQAFAGEEAHVSGAMQARQLVQQRAHLPGVLRRQAIAGARHDGLIRCKTGRTMTLRRRPAHFVSRARIRVKSAA
ncbi:hypothetical protein [Luteimonas mephitis]|uniref:hypothetical protein n=1 Tax=Luteimonas mephitis TaxID=83615 RepID=UPI001FDEB50B|nr:hypothetical protein [Luteimonas mephitis]